MDHVIAMAPEDTGEAEWLAAAIGTSGLAGRIRCLPISDEGELAAALEVDPDAKSTYVLIVSRALSERVVSLEAVDRLLSAILLGHRRVLAACLFKESAPSPELLRLARRHDAVADEPSLEGIARRVVGRLARLQVNASASANGRSVSPQTLRVRYWLVGIIVVLLALLAIATLTNLMRG